MAEPRWGSGVELHRKLRSGVSISEGESGFRGWVPTGMIDIVMLWSCFPEFGRQFHEGRAHRSLAPLRIPSTCLVSSTLQDFTLDGLVVDGDAQ